MPLVAKHLDFIIGVDIHITIYPPPPAGPGPIPLPYPFMAMVFDPMDWVPMIGATVKVNNMPRATASTQGMLAVPPLHHIPYGPGFLLEPMMGNDQKMFFGGAKTHAEGALLAAGPYMVMSCNDFGMPLSIKPGKNWKPIPSLYLPLSSSLPIPMGAPVNLNDPLVPDWTSMGKDILIGAAFGYAMKGAGALVTRFNHFLKGTKLGKDNPISRALCHLGFEPVDLVRGNVVSYVTDFELPGPIPLKWERQYSSNSFFKGSMGARWCTQYHQYLNYNPSEASFDWFTPDGRELLVPDLPFGESLLAKSERCTFYHDADGVRYFNHREHLWYHFGKTTSDKNHHSLVRITNNSGHNIRFAYTAQGILKEITDSAGRALIIRTGDNGFIEQIVLYELGNRVQLAGYRYNEDQDLVQILDTFDKPTNIRYHKHLMVEKTDRNGETFFWQYDSDESTARCTHTFGRENLMKGHLVYEQDRTIVFDALGNRRELIHQNGLVVEEVDSFGFSKKYSYNESMELIVETDELDRRTLYAYDLSGNCIATTLPDGNKTATQYNEAGLATLSIDGAGGIAIYNYDNEGHLTRIINADRSVVQYEYKQGRISKIITGTGQEILLSYDSFYNLVQLQYPDGRSKQWKYNYSGKCTQVLYPNGAIERYEYDAMGRLIGVATADDNYVRLEYDAYDDALIVKDRHTSVEMEYNPLGMLKKRRQRGSEIEFFYDNNNRLTSVKNEADESYYFRYSSTGSLIEEMGFDGLKKQFLRNEAGEVTTMVRPGGNMTTYERDGAGRVIAIHYHDGTSAWYEYDGVGRVTSAINEFSNLSLQRNAGGLIIKESQNDVVINRDYNLLGRPVGIKSNLGGDLKFTYNDWGDLEKMLGVTNHTNWQAELLRDINGFELQRHLPGEAILRYERDQAGNPLSQVLQIEGRHLIDKKYTWSAGRRLQSIADIQHQLLTTYQYNGEGHLTGSIQTNGRDTMPGRIVRVADETGNYYETEDRRDRKYGPGGRLLWKNGTEYFYNDEGSLIEKRGKEGRIWKYAYYATGYLKMVVRPDGKEVHFTYDAIGRRLSKTFNGWVTHWAWDGNVPLHEWREKDNLHQIGADGNVIPLEKEGLITWLFEPDTFVPCAKIADGETWSIVTDQLGTPTHMLNDKGRVVWEGSMDIYGRMTMSVGKREDLPLRYQGQYEDVETGLYYNRFRYYCPGEGMYISQDPLQLDSGCWAFYAYVKNTNRLVDTFGLYNGEGVRELGDYDAFHTGVLDPADYKKTDAYHFARGNESLHNRFQSDPAFAAAMDTKYPGIVEHVTPGAGGAFSGRAPAGTTWHHAETSGHLELVDRLDHRTYHTIYHPDGEGGRKKWGGGNICR